ncbi:MAG: HAMP domain-containing sensor histidine kinase [Verrucomicrobiales bacterium]|nr:HAMP domain-containing sensor histidine kinase [Verrucomicrobiales bacterium]
MKRIALVFFLAILLPSILLAVLAIRSVRDQSLIANSQRVLFYESTCESVAAEINLFMDEVRIFHGQMIGELARRRSSELVESFDRLITDSWSQASVGAVVTSGGVIISPQPGTTALADGFLENHRDFLVNGKTVEVYQAPAVLNSEVSIVEASAPASPAPGPSSAVLKDEVSDLSGTSAPVKSRSKLKVGVVQNKLQGQRFEYQAEAPDPAAGAEGETQPKLAASPVIQQRNVMPSQSSSFVEKEEREMDVSDFSSRGLSYSRLSPAELKSTDLTQSEAGAVSRLIDGQLHILLWQRVPAFPGYTFWTELDLETIKEDLNLLFSEMPFAPQEQVSLALLDSDGALVVQTETGFTTDWSRPFVASEVGQIFPRWEVAAYFIHPELLNRAARTLRWTLSLIVISLLVAVAVGTFLILKAVRYEMQLATRKTDFVSNVSHELKTPLTSIKLFSEMLAESKELDLEKTQNYSGIIHKEAARLSRLINRLLDFSRLDRDELPLKMEAVDLEDLVKESVATFEMQVSPAAMAVQVNSREGEPVMVNADRDALEQVVLNLLANAEKYAGEGGEILIEIAIFREKRAILSVSDRGPGIPRALREKVFEKFYRIDESMHSGIDGSGIGLALCCQLVEKHEGEIRCEPRDGGGTTFIVELPLRIEHEE